MYSSLFSRGFGLALAALSLAVPAISRAQSGYTITDIGSLGGTVIQPHSINASGQVVGEAALTNFAGFRGFLYDSAGLHDLGAVAGSNSYAQSINDSGRIAGTNNAHAALWNGGIVTEIAAGYGNGISNNGQVTGNYQVTYYGPFHAFRYANGIVTDLGTLGGDKSVGYAINDSGTIAGQSQTADGSTYHAAVWTGNTAVDLGTLGGDHSEAFAINASGQIAGYSDTILGAAQHATLWNGTTPTDLGAMYGGNSWATGLNAFGDVVGYSYGPASSATAFLYTNGGMIDLNTVLPPGSGWLLKEALAINDNGWIAGVGLHNGLNHAFLLVPNRSTAFGSLALEGVSNVYKVRKAPLLGTFHIAFRKPGTMQEVYSADGTMTPLSGKSYGTFAISNIPPGQYDIAIKGATSLRVVLPDVTVTARTLLSNVTLLAGDVNGDNSIDPTDFATFVSVYGSSAAFPEPATTRPAISTSMVW